MSFTKVTPHRNVKSRQNVTTGDDLPLRPTYIKDSHYQNELALEKERVMAVNPQNEHRLQMDGLCVNTMENISNSTGDEENIEARQRRVLSCSAVLISIVFIISLISLVLTLLMLTGNVSTRCSSGSTKVQLTRSKPIRMAGFSCIRGEVISGSEFERWLISILRNITENMDNHSRNFDLLKDAFRNMNEKREKNDKRLQESVAETKRDLDSNINRMEMTMTDIRSAVVSLNQSSTKPGRQSNKTFDLSLVFKNVTRLQNQVKQECKRNYSKLQTRLDKAESNFETALTKLVESTDKINKTTHKIQWEITGGIDGMSKMDSKMDILQTMINKTATAKDLFSTSTKLQQELREVRKNARYELNLTKDEFKSSLQDLSSDLLEAKTYLIKQIENITKREDPRDPTLGNTAGYNGSTRVNGYIENAANFSQCQYKVEESPGIPKSNSGVLSVDVTLLEPQGKRIVGSTCSTKGAEEYIFNRHNNTAGQNVYQCICKGTSRLFYTTGDKIYCYLHYWECPFMT